MKIIYIGLLSLCVQISISGQAPCNEALDSFTFIPKLDPDTEYEPFTEGYTSNDDLQVPPPAVDGYKKVITWVHGMNGNSASWVHASNYADVQYKALPLRIDYNDFQASLDVVRAGVKSDFLIKWEALKDLTDDVGKSKSFAIAHSLGGIAIRGASEEYPYLEGKVNGIVTVNSPHGGSPLADYIDASNGPGSQDLVDDMIRFAEHTCKEMAAGPVEEAIVTNKWLRLIERTKILSESFVTDLGCSVASALVIPNLIAGIAPVAVSELSLGSPSLDINERVSDENKMLFATSIVDNPDAHHHAFKLFYSAQNSPNQRAWTGADALTEEALNALAEDKNWYNSKYLEWKNHYDNKPSWKADWMCWKPALPSALFCQTYGDVRNMMEGYNGGRFQFRKINDFWEYAVGARTYEVPLGTCEFEDQFGNVWADPLENVLEEECVGGYWYSYTPQSTLVDYDGLLTTESQSDWSSCPQTRKYSLTPNNGFKGSDHLQIKNDSNAKYIVDFTLTGQGAIFFKN